MLPEGYPKGLYDESKVPAYTLPDLMTTLGSEKVATKEDWQLVRRDEILKLFEEHVYGRTVARRPESMTWETTATDPQAMSGRATEKTVAIYFWGKKDGPQMHLKLTLPNAATGPVPVFLIPGWAIGAERLIARGYGLANFDANEIEPDVREGSWEKSVRQAFAKPGQTGPEAGEWGAIGAWAWAMGRAMDYLETDPGVHPKKVAVMGFSRYGKVAMWAGAQDRRFAAVFSGESGCGGAVIVRRGFGETVASINGYAPHWFSQNFKTYNDRVDELPVDWHELVALIAPRPVYIATAEEDYWGDPQGSFLSGLHAAPVYRLFGKNGYGTEAMPPTETAIGDYIGYHNRKGGHGVTDYDWDRWLDFADRHLGVSKPWVEPKAYHWTESDLVKNRNGEKRHILEGQTRDWKHFTMQAVTLYPGKSGSNYATRENEALLIVKEGELKVTVDGVTKTLVPNSVAMILPGAEHRVENAAAADGTFYVLQYTSRSTMDAARGERAGGSFLVDWNGLAFRPHDKGGVRSYFDRPTAACNLFEMHVTNLNPGIKSHEPHTHRTAEMFVMIKGDTEIQIGDSFFQGSAGDVYFIESDLPHAIRNTGGEQAVYFAFQWE